MTTQLLYSCDDVFELLTRGPISDDTLEQSSRESLQRHLMSCHECRALAEALRPATDCFHEALAAEERAGLPQFASDLPVSVFKRSPTPRRLGRPLMMAIVATLFLMTGAAAWFGSSGETVAQQTQMLGAIDCLPALQLPDSCGKYDASAEITNCCTSCHQATGDRTMADVGLWRLLNSCTACHQQKEQAKFALLSQRACDQCHQPSGLRSRL